MASDEELEVMGIEPFYCHDTEFDCRCCSQNCNECFCFDEYTLFKIEVTDGEQGS